MISIVETTVGTVGSCKVGVSNIFVETFTDDGGQKREEARVSLSIFGEPPCQKKTIRVYQGQHIQIGDRGFVVAKITAKKGGRGSVELSPSKS